MSCLLPCCHMLVGRSVYCPFTRIFVAIFSFSPLRQIMNKFLFISRLIVLNFASSVRKLGNENLCTLKIPREGIESGFHVLHFFFLIGSLIFHF